MYRILAPVILLLIFGLPLAVMGLPYALYPAAWVLILTLFVAPLGYALLFVLTAGLLSRPFQRAIIPGRFPRDLTHPVYRARRLYGLCWTCVYYFKPVYFLCLGIPGLKWLTFRLFGYRGLMKFTIYPDTWIRDLPLLDFGEGAYVANRATLGTNLALNNGQTLVDRITIARGATVGHLTMLAPNVEIGAGSEIAAGCIIGVQCRIGEGAVIQAASGLNHLSQIGDGVIVGTMSYVGTGAVISNGIKLPAGSVVPNTAMIASQAHVQALMSTPVSQMTTLATRLRGIERGPDVTEEDASAVAGRSR
jgi:carbonic anhydrase/acetyltransferase-like protein (isoleucine patch superfamily)